MLRVTLVLVAALGAGAACAQAPLTLEEARRLALQRQPSLQALELNERALLVQSSAEAALPDPVPHTTSACRVPGRWLERYC